MKNLDKVKYGADACAVAVELMARVFQQDINGGGAGPTPGPCGPPGCAKATCLLALSVRRRCPTLPGGPPPEPGRPPGWAQLVPVHGPRARGRPGPVACDPRLHLSRRSPTIFSA